ncbi:MAG: MATE family efflux transporter [Chloroflexota bacterium]
MKQAEGHRSEIMGQGRIMGLLLRFSGPAILANLVQASFNIVDTAFVSRLGLAPLAAMAIAYPLMIVYNALGQAIGTGAASIISRRLGAGRHEDANRAAANAITTFFLFGGILTVICLVSLRFLMRIFGASDEVMPHALSYMRVETAFLVVNFFLMVLVDLIRAEGNPVLASTASIVSMLGNLVFDPLLGFGIGPFPMMGMAGFALATTVGRGLGIAILLVYLSSRRSSYRFQPSYFIPNFKLIGEIFRIGTTRFVQQAGQALTRSVDNNIAVSFGTAPLAVVGVLFKIRDLFVQPSTGLGQGMMPLIGYNYGAHKKERVGEIVVKAGLVSFAWGATCWLVMLLFTAPILSVFGSDPGYLTLGIAASRIFSLTFFFTGTQMALNYFFQGLGRAVASLIVASSRQFFFILPLVLLFSRIFGLNGIWIAYPVGNFLSLTLTLIWIVAECRSQEIPLRLRYKEPPQESLIKLTPEDLGSPD